MKKLLLILLCLPIIGFGQDRKDTPFSFAIGPNSLIPFNSTHNSINVHTNTGISANLSYKIYITQHYTYNAKYIPSISFNLVSFTQSLDPGIIVNSNFSLLSIRNGIEKNINNRLSFSLATSFDILLNDKGTYTINWAEKPSYDSWNLRNLQAPGYVSPPVEDVQLSSVKEYEYERDRLLGYYGSFNIKFSYVIFQFQILHQFLQFFVFTDFNVPFYYSKTHEVHELTDLQFNRFSSVGLGLNF